MRTVIKIRLKFIILISLFVFTLGCGIIDDELNAFPYELMISVTDLPNYHEYNNSDSNFPKVSGAKAFEVFYSKSTGKFGTKIHHEITIYQNVEAALSSFPLWERVNLKSSGWIPSEEIEFKPRDPEDEYIFKCSTFQLNGNADQICTLLQLHKNLVILVDVNINDDNMTFAEFDEVLKKLDAKLPDEVVPMPPE